VTITGQRIRLNAADTRIQQVSKSNALNRVMMIDSITEQIYYRDVSKAVLLVVAVAPAQ
jgi:hypothetical protein